MHWSEQEIRVALAGTLFCAFALDLAAGCLNWKSAHGPVPEELSDVHDPGGYARSQDYLKANTALELTEQGVFLMVLLFFWFFSGFGLMDTWVRQWGMNDVFSGLLFFGILALARGMVGLPFRLYATFVIEERFGFNTTTTALFFQDLGKSVLIATVVGGGLLALVLLFFNTLGPNGWVLCWAVSVLFIFAAHYIVPTWIMPLFNRFTPLEEGPLKEAVVAYAQSIDFSLSNIMVMDGSKRSTKSNAFFTGWGRHKRIVLLDTLVKRHKTEELVAVLAHEMGHYKLRHIPKRMILGILYTGMMFFLVSVCISAPVIFKTFFVDTISVYAGLVFFSLLFSPVDMVLSLFMHQSSRKDEYAADAFAARTLKDANGLCNALKKLSGHNLSNLTPHPFYVVLNYSHPPILERLRALSSCMPPRAAV